MKNPLCENGGFFYVLGRSMEALQSIREAWHEAFFLDNLELFEFLKHRNFSSEIEGYVLNKQEHKKNVELLISRRKLNIQTVQKTDTDVQTIRNGNSVCISGVAHITINAKVSTTHRFLEVWVLEKNQWKIIYYSSLKN